MLCTNVSHASHHTPSQHVVSPRFAPGPRSMPYLPQVALKAVQPSTKICSQVACSHTFNLARRPRLLKPPRPNPMSLWRARGSQGSRSSMACFGDVNTNKTDDRTASLGQSQSNVQQEAFRRAILRAGRVRVSRRKGKFLSTTYRLVQVKSRKKYLPGTNTARNISSKREY